MAYSGFPNLAAVASEYRLQVVEAAFVVPVPGPVNDYFRAEFEFTRSEMICTNSELTAAETMVFPILREVWRAYHDTLTLWPHEPLNFDARLSGTPDYFVAKRSPLGKYVRDLPYLVIVETKKDDFEQGWGQGLAGMVAAQKLNRTPNTTVYGIVTNGLGWQFGRLESNQFTLDPRQKGLWDLNDLCAAIRYVFEECKRQVQALPPPAQAG
jgi:hypothetical protein